MSATVRRHSAALAALLGAGTLAAGPLRAQSLREFDVARQLKGEPRLAVEVRYAAGSLLLRPAPQGSLYRLRLTYDEDRFRPLVSYDAASARLALGAEPLGRGGIFARHAEPAPQAATVELSGEADLDLAVSLGATEGTLELGGLRLSHVQVEAGASRTQVRFSAPNPVRCALLRIKAGGGEATFTGLGNARCERVDFEGGIGETTLDFTGAWTGTMAVHADMAVGGLVLRLPRDAGVRLHLDRFLARFAPSGLVAGPDGTTWTTRAWDAAPRRLDIDLTSAVGGVRVAWAD